MPKKVTPLTATQVKNAKPFTNGKKKRLSDGNGLFLTIEPNGVRYWELRVTNKGKTNTLYNSFKDFTLQEARQWRDEMRSRAAKHLPLKENEDNVFESVFYAWHDRWSLNVTEKYAKQVKSAVSKNVMPHLGNMFVKDIRPVDIITSLKKMEDRGTLEYLKRTKTGIKLALDFAVSRGMIDVNPALSVTPNAFKKPVTQHMRALSPDKLPYLIQQIEKAKLTDRITLQTYFLIYFQLITMSRSTEAASARWDNIKDDVWIIPSKNMKARREHRVPLPPMLLNILDFLKQINTGDYVFTGKRGHIDSETVNKAFTRLNIDSTAHGLRTLARTYLEETNKFRREALEVCLAHKVGSSVEQAYNRTDYLEERREILDYWASVIEHEKEKAQVV